MKKFFLAWSLQKKINIYVRIVLLLLTVSVAVNFWIVRFSMREFAYILDMNARVTDFSDRMRQEQADFVSFMREPDEEKETSLSRSMEDTRRALLALPFSYAEIGAERYARTRLIKNSYETYAALRDGLLTQGQGALGQEAAGQETPKQGVTGQETPGQSGEGAKAAQGETSKETASHVPDIETLYRVYAMQEYICGYADTLMRYTQEDGARMYEERLFYFQMLPYVLLTFSLFLLVACLFVSRMLRKGILAPIVSLAEASKRIAANDFDVPDVTTDAQDEMGELVHAFNKMKYATGEFIGALEEKREVMELLHKEELQTVEAKRRLESVRLELLKSQVNPHFLFNTLNVISGMASIEDAPTTQEMIRALASIFRYSLNVPEEEVSLFQELRIAEDYMYLQKMRFGERIVYEVDCQVNPELVFIPSFTLQPLVENAILHGIGKKEEGGRIDVEIRNEEGALTIRISDTGAGMDAQTLAAVRKALLPAGALPQTQASPQGRLSQTESPLHTEADGSGETRSGQRVVGIGLGNICKRIQTLHPDSTFQINSTQGVGTEIFITLP